MRLAEEDPEKAASQLEVVRVQGRTLSQGACPSPGIGTKGRKGHLARRVQPAAEEARREGEGRAESTATEDNDDAEPEAAAEGSKGAQAQGHGQAQAQGQGQGHRASGQDYPLTPSRKARWRI